MKDEQQKVTELCATAAVYLAGDDVTSALSFYQKALDIDPNHPDSLIGCGLAYYKTAGMQATVENKTELYANAIVQFEKADNIKPVEHDILICMQEIYTIQGSSSKLKGINERLRNE